MNKCGLITSGVFGVLTTLALVIFAVAIPLHLQSIETEFRDDYGDEYYEAVWQQVHIRVGFMFGGAVLWALATALMFVFACTRYERVVHSYETVVAVIV